MEILSYPVGLLIGLFPVMVDLGGPQQAAAGMEKTFALSLAADPRDENVFYAATAGSGVFKSTDAGQTWKPAGRELERTVVRCVAADGGGGESVYAGTLGHGVVVMPVVSSGGVVR